jgi:hypothetical protein
VFVVRARLGIQALISEVGSRRADRKRRQPTSDDGGHIHLFYFVCVRLFLFARPQRAHQISGHCAKASTPIHQQPTDSSILHLQFARTKKRPANSSPHRASCLVREKYEGARVANVQVHKAMTH